MPIPIPLNYNCDFLTIKYPQPSGAAAPAVVAARQAMSVAPGAGRLALAVYPNPAAGAVQVLVYNQFSKPVATLYNGALRQGQSYELSLNSEKLPAGLYTCSLLVGGQRETVRLLV